jgi:hypothetical protein
LKLAKHNNPALVATLAVVLALSIAGVCVELRKVQADASASPIAAQAPTAPTAAATPAQAVPAQPRYAALAQSATTNDPFVAPPPATGATADTSPITPLPLSALSPSAVRTMTIPGPSTLPPLTEPTSASPASAAPAPTIGAANQMPASGPAGGWRVCAVIDGGDQPAAIISGPGTPSVSVSVGDQVAGYTVAEITDGGVRLTGKSGTQNLSLNGQSQNQPANGANPKQETSINATP